MRDAPGQDADTFQLFGLEQSLGPLLLFGDVTQQAAEFGRLTAQSRGHDLGEEPGAVFANLPGFRDYGTKLPRALDIALAGALFLVFRREEAAETPTFHFLFREAEKAFGAGAPAGDEAPVVDRKERVVF